MTRYTKEDRQYFEQLELDNRLLKTQQFLDAGGIVDEPESNLSKWLRQHCKDHGYPALIFPQTQDVRNFLPPGYPDAVISLPNRIIFMEIKRPKGGRKSPAQKEMAIRFLHLGHKIHEVKTRKRIIEIIYGG